MIGYNGLDNLMWFLGYVAVSEDPAKLGRIRVRVFGVHPTVAENTVPDEDLPWAYVMRPNSVMFGEFKVGDMVFGCFLDGRDAQQPLVLGMIGTNKVGSPVPIQVDRRSLADPGSGPLGARADGSDVNAAERGENGVKDDKPVGGKNIVPPEALENDAAFQAKLDEMIQKYPGLTKQEIYKIIKGESGFNTQAVNESGATGLFQLMPDSAKDIGYTTAQIYNMSAAQQLQVYDEYLAFWNYNGSNALGMMQAAPAYASSRNGNDVVYRVGTKAWIANPPWRPPGGGDITVNSINAYYNKQ